MFQYGFEETAAAVHLWCEKDGKRKSEARLLTASGANLCGFSVDGVEYLVPPPPAGSDNRHFGTPVLYPFPGVIKDRKFTFDGVDYSFEPNRGEVFRHGYVSDQKFEGSQPEVLEDGICLRTWIEIRQEHPLFTVFPVENRLDLHFTLKPDSLLINFLGTNLDSRNRFPFGFGLHPYLNIIGPRETVSVTVPMKKWMNLDSGELLDPSVGPADFRKPFSLAGLDIDAVWWGMEPEQPHSVRFHSVQKQFKAVASGIFTHSVTYCPGKSNFFCLENWTCSPNAPNFAANGKAEASHLTILDPGTSASGSVMYIIEDID